VAHPLARAAVQLEWRRRAFLAAPMHLPLFDLSPAAQREWLVERLARPAPPAARAQSEVYRFPGREGRAIPAAVLVPLVNRPAGLQVLLTERAAHLPDHPGQISFPGGRVEPQDASDAAAALRETHEEVGLAAQHVQVLGQLARYDTVSGFRVTPVVGWVEPPFTLAPDPLEVASVFEVPLAFLLDEANHQRQQKQVGNGMREVWAMPYGERYIWGATAAMLRILVHTLAP
jgi:8-oxo-dGTP pyrophosphatase MutT (NUDIX family)